MSIAESDHNLVNPSSGRSSVTADRDPGAGPMWAGYIMPGPFLSSRGRPLYYPTHRVDAASVRPRSRIVKRYGDHQPSKLIFSKKLKPKRNEQALSPWCGSINPAMGSQSFEERGVATDDMA